MYRDQDWISPNRAEQMDGPSYMGPCTFMKTPALFEPSELDQIRPDVAIVGAPWDSTTSWRAGTRLGPRSIRTANWTYPFYHLDLEVAPFDELRVIDYGDAVCPTSWPIQHDVYVPCGHVNQLDLTGAHGATNAVGANGGKGGILTKVAIGFSDGYLIDKPK